MFPGVPLNQSFRMLLHEVKDSRSEKEFLGVSIKCNENNPNWIRPLDRDIQSIFDPAKNNLFKTGAAIRWILKDDQGHMLGRIAAFVNKKYKNKGDNLPVGGIGFFDCIDDPRSAALLFDGAREWLSSKGMRAMDGPINFGERDKWWGLLTDGFQPPIYGMNYNPPYYQNLFEQYGFKVFYNQICWSLPVADSNNQLSAKFYEVHKRFENDPDFKATYLRKKDFRKIATDFCKVYNKAWSKHEGNKELSEAVALKMFEKMKPVMDENLVWFVYYKNEPVATWISIPDINAIIKRLNGQFNLWSKLKFLYYKNTGICSRFVGIVFGIVPQFQGTGVDYFMIVEAEKVIKSVGQYKETELMWQGDFNPKMLNISRNLGAEQSRNLITYRYLFDRDLPFERHPILS